VAEGLTVDVERMRRNIESTQGAVFSEGARYRAVASGLEPEDYLGSAEQFRRRLLV
jgi:adenylosuccinate lyase